MSSRDIEERFKDIASKERLVCTEEEFNEFQNYGYLIPIGKSYLTRSGKKIEVTIIKQVAHRFDINLSEIIKKAVMTSKDDKYKRVYCMSQITYDKYVERGYIIEQDNKKYYRFFEGELWLVMIL